MTKIAVYPFPYSSKNNKYVSLLYSNLNRITDNFGYEIINCENKFANLLRLSKNSKKFTKNIVHIHWINAVYGSKFLAKSIFLMFFNFSILIFLKKIKKFRIIWTKHNYFSHDFPYPLIDRIGRGVMLRLADRVIIQQKSEYEKFKNNKKFAFIPHGNYINVYGPFGDGNKIRNKFGVGNDEIFVISLGIVKPYKKIENIIRSFRKSSNSKLKLLVTGQALEEYSKKLKQEAEGSDKIVLDFNFVEDREIPNYFAAADFSVFWYDDSVLTSGGVLAALSYGVPVIARNIPASELIKERENGFIYKTESQLTSIFNGLGNGRFDREKVISSVENLSWESVAGKLAEEFNKI